MTRLALFILLIIISSSAVGQSAFSVKSFSSKSGLPSNNLYSLTKDKQGFIWITSDNGLSRFDGNSFSSFQNDNKNPNSLSSNICDKVLVDSKDNIWVKTLYGLSLFNNEKNTFKNYYFDKKNGEDLFGGDLIEDSLGKIWIGGYQGISFFDPSTGKFSNAKWLEYAKLNNLIKYERRNNAALYLSKKSNEELWILTTYGLFSVNTSTLKYNYYPNKDVEDYWGFSFYGRDENVLWIGSYDHCFYAFNTQNFTWKHYSCPPSIHYPNGKAHFIYPKGEDTLFVIVNDFPYYYDKIKNTFTKISEYEDKGFELFNQIRSILFNKNQFFFIRSTKDPLLLLTKNETWSKSKNLPLHSKYVNNISYITLFSDEVLTGDWDKKEILVCNDKNCKPLTYQGSKKIGQLQSYFQIKDHIALISCSKQLYLLNEVTHDLESIKIPSHLIEKPNLEFRNAIIDKNDNIYIRERTSGIYKLDIITKELIPFFNESAPFQYNTMYYDVYTDKIWYALDNNGLYVLDPQTKVKKHYPLILNTNVSNSKVNYITGDENGNIYVSLSNQGLMHIQSKSMITKTYQIEDGLPTDNTLYGVCDSEGRYWGTTLQGLFTLKNGTVTNFVNDAAGEKYTYRLLLDKKGNVYQNLFPSNVLWFSPNEVMSQTKPNGQLYLKSIKVKDKNVDKTQIQFSHFDNDLSISFGLIDTTLKNDLILEYRINTGSWKPLNKDGNLQLYALAPGKYKIEARQKLQPSEILTHQIIINKPWWQSTFFYLAMLSSLGLTSYYLYRLRISNIRKEEQKKAEIQQRIAKTEMTALRAQMNPHFIFNCLNSINRFILLNETDTASDYLTIFSKLIRTILDNSRSDLISLAQELEALELYIKMEAMRFQDSFQWTINVDSVIQLELIQIPPLILQPYIENAIWHGLMHKPADQIKLLTIDINQLKDEDILIEIRDNGIGRDKSKQFKSKEQNTRKSHGTLLSQERLSLMEVVSNNKAEIQIKDLYNDHGEAEGTLVTIFIKSLK